MKKPSHKFIVAVKIGDSTYKSAHRAAEAWGMEIYRRMYNRHSKKIGCAAYHDAAWSARNEWDAQSNCVNAGPLVVYQDMRVAQKKAYRRSLKIFKKVLPR